MRKLTNIRDGESRNTWAAFTMLFVLIASHSVLETARDALFLAKIPAENLPWVYLGIAALSLIVTQLQARISGGLPGRVALGVWTLAAAFITFGFWATASRFGAAGLYALYIWSGLLTTLVLVHFWILLGDLFSVTQAKRLYGLIGAGSVVGAIVGSAVAGALATTLDDPSNLLLVTASGLALASVIPFGFRGGYTKRPGDGPRATESLLASARFVVSKPYTRRLVVMLLIAAAAVTVADYLFKSAAAAHVPADSLGTFFGSVYLVLNVLSLAAQLLLVGWLIRRFTINVALVVLPSLLVIGGSMMLLTGGVVAALLIKGADGSLRYSLHRTSTELLYVPLSSAARRRVKAFIDVVGQRGGQSIASIAILSLVAIGAGPRALSVVLIVLAIAWVTSALDLHRYYLDIFRRRLDRNSAARLEDYPSLDLGSLETLIEALDSTDDREVLASLDVLERERKAQLIPALILYHPSDEVVVSALEVLTRSRRSSAIHIIDRIIATHRSESVRAAAVAARSVVEFDERALRELLSSEDSAVVRTSVMVNLIAAGVLVGSEARDTVRALLKNGSTEAVVALAEAIGRRKVTDLEDILLEVSHDQLAARRPEVVRALGSLATPACLDRLVRLLVSESARRNARMALRDSEEAGLDALKRALGSRELAAGVRWQLPAAIAEFAPETAFSVLMENLPDEWDGMLRYRSIRALEAIAKQHPDVRFDRGRLWEAIDLTVARCYRQIDRRVSLDRGALEMASRKTPGHLLLADILADKEANAVGRVFRLLGLAYPTEEFDSIYRSLGSGERSRADSLELIENILQQPLRGAIAGLIDDISPAERLSAGRGYHEPANLDYEALLNALLGSSSDIVQDVAVYHIGELHLTQFKTRIAEIASDASAARTDFPRVLSILDGDTSVY